MDPKLRKLLGLTESATIDEAAIAIESLAGRAARVDGLEAELAASRQALAAARVALEEQQRAQAKAEKAARDQEIAHAEARLHGQEA